MSKRLISLMMVVIMLCLSAIPTYASLYHKTDGEGLSAGDCTPRIDLSGSSIYPIDVKYYITPNYRYLDAYKDATRDGADSWESTYVSFVEATDNSESICDFKCYNGATLTEDHDNYEFKDYLAYTKVYCGSGPYQSDNVGYTDSLDIPRDYWGAEIFMNVSMWSTDNLVLVQKTVAHELGHFLGLGHVAGTNNIMFSNLELCRLTAPSDYEKEAVMSLYDSRSCNCESYCSCWVNNACSCDNLN